MFLAVCYGIAAVLVLIAVLHHLARYLLKKESNSEETDHREP